MAKEEDKGFKVTDKRIRLDEEESDKKIEEETPNSGRDDAGSKTEEQKEGQESPPHHVTFSNFILSLATSTLIYLGEEENPVTKEREPNLLQAKEMIDLIEILEKKTKGNLTTEEENLLTNLLFTLRMKYLERSKR